MADEILPVGQKADIDRLIEMLLYGESGTAAKFREITSGVVYPYNEDGTNRHIVEGTTASGPFRLIGKLTEDIQASTPEWINSPRKADCAPELLSETALPGIVDRLRNKAIPVDGRLQILREYLEHDQLAATAYIVNELETTDIETRWRDNLIFVAEDVQFTDPAVRNRIKNRLFALASLLRRGSSPDAERVTFSAIRTYASLIEVSEIGNMLPFLEPPIYADSRLVTIQSVVRVLEASAGQPSHALESIADRVFQLAMGFLHPDMLIPGEPAAIAQNALHALALIGDPRATDGVAQVKQLNKRWFTRQVRQRLERTLEAWKADQIAGELHPIYDSVRGLLTFLS